MDGEFDAVTCIEAMRQEIEWELEQNRRERMNEIWEKQDAGNWPETPSRIRNTGKRAS